MSLKFLLVLLSANFVMVRPGCSAASPRYEAWKNEHFSAADLADPNREASVWGLTADPDGDGCENILEYASGSDPNVFGWPWTPTLAPDLDGAPSGLLLAYKRRFDDAVLTYSAKASSNLIDWNGYAGSGVVERYGLPVTAGHFIEDVALRLAEPGNGTTTEYYRMAVAMDGPRYPLYGLSFSPYIDSDEDPETGLAGQITEDELLERLQMVAPYVTWVRSFASNDDLAPFGRIAHELGLKAAVGVWIEPGGVPENDIQIDCLAAQASSGYVDMVIVGSEFLLRNNTDQAEAALLGYIAEVKSRLQQLGLGHIPVTTADVYSVLLARPAVIAASDCVLANIYGFWESEPIDTAIGKLDVSYRRLVEAANGKEVMLSETGWPSCGAPYFDAVPSPENAARYFKESVSWARQNSVKMFYFSALDELWKVRKEGDRGACWGILKRDGSLKWGMRDVFDLADAGGFVLPADLVIDFFRAPATMTTNIPVYLVAGDTAPGNEVRVNGVLLASGAEIDSSGTFAATVPLSGGDNSIEVAITAASGDPVKTATKTISYDPNWSTGSRRLLYVDVVPGPGGEPGLSGTVVIDLDGNAVFGVLGGRHVRGISPSGAEIYMDDRTVVATNTHQDLRTLPFSGPIGANEFLISPDGATLLAGDEITDLATNQLVTPDLPQSIRTGSSWAGAPIPGGAAIDPTGTIVFCANPVKKIDLVANTSSPTGISAELLSDLAVSPSGEKLVVSEFAYGNGRLDVYDAQTFEDLGTIGGLGDFVGEVAFLGERAVVGSAGNPADGYGRLSVIDLDDLSVLDSVGMPLAANLAVSDQDEVFVSVGARASSYGDRCGVDVYEVDPSGALHLSKSFFLGINAFSASTGAPESDQVRGIFYKP